MLFSIDGGFPPAKSGAGGSGRFGLPPYSDEGVPGRGEPLSSAGSYGMFIDGGRIQSVFCCEGVHGLDGESDRIGDRGGMYAEASLLGGGMAGMSSRTDLLRACIGWYDLCKGLGLRNVRYVLCFRPPIAS